MNSSRFVLAIVFMNAVLSVKAQNCGTDRWSVKTLSDPDTVNIDFHHLVKTTVHEQVPIFHQGKFINRQADETKVYSIDCYILGFKKEKDDKDFHVIIRDENTEETMVAEIPSADCFEIQKTSRADLFRNLQIWFIENVGRPKSKFYFLSEPLHVNITGVGFFDHMHGQRGMAENGREIHPVLSIRLIQKK